jgi:hypothetical protein
LFFFDPSLFFLFVEPQSRIQISGEYTEEAKMLGGERGFVGCYEPLPAPKEFLAGVWGMYVLQAGIILPKSEVRVQLLTVYEDAAPSPQVFLAKNRWKSHLHFGTNDERLETTSFWR